MYQAPEQFAALNKANIEATINFAHIALQGTERLLDLQLKAAKDVLAQGVKNAKALTEAKDVQQAIALQSSSAQPSFEKAIGYSRSLYEVASETQAEIAKLFEARFADFNSSFVAAVDQAAKSAPAGSDAAFAAVRNAVAAATSAYDTMTKAAKQVKDIAEANVTAATVRATNGAKRKAA
jgi:phasin family protein